MFFKYKSIYLFIIFLGFIWSVCEVFLPYLWSQGTVDLSCYLLWLLGQCILRLQGFIGAKLWPFLTRKVRELYWKDCFIELNAKKMIAFNLLIDNLKILLITSTYRIITPSVFSIVTIVALAKLNVLTSLYILIWLFGHIFIMWRNSKKLIKMSEQVFFARLVLETLERSNNLNLSLLMSSNLICYFNNKALNMKIEVVLILQSLWLGLMLVLVYIISPKVVIFVLWLQLINQIWNIGTSWHEFVRSYAGINKLVGQI
jgi:hypothetical protein